MSVFIFTDNPATGETGLVRRELIDRGIFVDYMAPWDISFPGFEPNYHLSYVPSNMLHRGSTFEFVHRLLILRMLEDTGIVVNPVASMLNYSKEHLTLQLKKLGLPHPETLITENIEAASVFASRLLSEDREVVLKPICLSRGTGVTKLSRIRSRADLTQYLLWYTRSFGEGVFYLQEYVPNMGYDVRCFVIDGEVIGREARSNPDDFRYNVAAGGNAEPFEDEMYDELAVRVADAVGLKITGLDILPREDGEPMVIEANCYPGYKALMETTKVPIHKFIVDYFERVIKS
ncbi:RimK family alpha-L-glutamate ligase [Thermoproteota archaeon]